MIDWAAASDGKDTWVYDDGVHLRPAGARALAELMREAALSPAPEEKPERDEPSDEVTALLGQGPTLAQRVPGAHCRRSWWPCWPPCS